MRMNSVADQPTMAFFLWGIYSDSSDRTYLKLKCYERAILSDRQKERESGVYASLSVKTGKARGIYQWNELASDLASDNCHINTALG